jgi:hypothetical protein
MEKTLSHFRKYGNGTLQIRKRTDKSGKRNGSEREFFRPFSTLVPRTHSLFVVSAAATKGEKNSLVCPTSKAHVCSQLISRSCGAALYGWGMSSKVFSICVRSAQEDLLLKHDTGGCLATADRVFFNTSQMQQFYSSIGNGYLTSISFHFFSFPFFWNGRPA